MDMSCIKGLIGLAVLALIAGVVVMFSGVVNIAATNPHNPMTAFVLSTTMDNSVRYHAKGITAPPLDDPQMVMEGFRHYREMCVGCHLAPGIRSTEIRKGLMPKPPKLQEAVEEWKPNELFWVIKNGVRMTGMPAWGPTHSDRKIWAMVAFLEKLPHMTVEQYKEMDKMAGPDEDDEGEHHHHDEADDHHHDDEDHDHGDEGDHQH
jgi:mono/diheme cytochrome c family protein